MFAGFAMVGRDGALLAKAGLPPERMSDAVTTGGNAVAQSDPCVNYGPHRGLDTRVRTRQPSLNAGFPMTSFQGARFFIRCSRWALWHSRCQVRNVVPLYFIQP
jgi:hypothetical protein